MIQDFEHIPDYRQRLLYNGRELDDDRTLSYYHICMNSILSLERRNKFQVAVKTLT